MTDNNVGKAMNTAMHTKLLQYYNAQTLDVLNITAFLDPRFKSLNLGRQSFNSLNNAGKICSLLLNSDSISDHPSGSGSTESTSSSEINIVSSESSDVTPAAKHKKQSKANLWSYLGYELIQTRHHMFNDDVH